MIKKGILWLTIVLLCVAVASSQSKRRSSASKAAIVTYQSDGPDKGMYQWGTFYLKIDGAVKLFYWGDKTSFHKSIYNSPNAYKRGAQWRITYKVDSDSNADFYLLSAAFTGRVIK